MLLAVDCTHSKSDYQTFLNRLLTELRLAGLILCKHLYDNNVGSVTSILLLIIHYMYNSVIKLLTKLFYLLATLIVYTDNYLFILFFIHSFTLKTISAWVPNQLTTQSSNLCMHIATSHMVAISVVNNPAIIC